MIVIIALVSNTLAFWLATPLIDEYLKGEQKWVADLVWRSVQNALMLVIFVLFIIVGVREVSLPVMRLSAMAKRIAEGDFSVQIPHSNRRDEIGVLQRSFAAMGKGLRSTEHIQKEFISNVSHEYRTPLAVMAGYTRQLADDVLTPEDRRRYSDFVLEEISRLSRMTSNILLLSKLEHQGIMPHMEAFSLDEQVRQAALLYVDKAREKEIALEIDMPPMRIHGHEDLVAHVWTNLLENAIKFTGEGGAVSVRAKETGSHTAISVQDSGMGMDAETKRRVFEKFYQGDSSRQDAGSGLGLALVKRIVELHRGSLRVDSVPMAGSTFTVTLPQRRVNAWREPR